MEARASRSRGRVPKVQTVAATEAELFEALIGSGDLEEVVRRVLMVLPRHVPFDWAGLVERDMEAGSLAVAWARQQSGDMRPDPWPLLFGSISFDFPERPCSTPLPVEWGRPLTSQLHDRGIRQILCAPLGVARSSRSVLVLGKRTASGYNGRCLALVEKAAGAMGWAHEVSARERELERRVEERTKELAILYDVSKAGGTSFRYDHWLPELMGSLHQLLGFDLAALLVDQAGMRELSVHLLRPAAPDCEREAAGYARSTFRGFSGREAAEIPLSVRLLPSFEPEAAPVRGALVARLAAPLVRKREVVGSLVVLARRPDAFSPGSARLLETVANHASLALDRLRSVQEAEESRLQSIIDSMPEGVLMADRSLRVTFANPAARRVLDRLAPGVPPASFDALGGASIAALAAPVLQGKRRTATAEAELHDPRRIYSISATAVAGTGTGSRPGAIVIVLSDVTQARLMQEQLLQTEKLSAIGEMISGVAHELNNPLASVMGFSQLLSGAAVEAEVARKLAVIHSEAQRCQRIVQNLLSFARKHEPERRLVDVNSALSAVMTLLSYQMRADGVEVRASLDPHLPWIIGDEHLLQQVFMNIVNNALQAMRECDAKRLLEIRTVGVRTPEDEDRATVRVEIRDTGPGIRPENLTRIFDPFFTTKSPGQGTGLGLSLAYAAIRQHRGSLRARSRPGESTVFVIELPQGDARDLIGGERPAARAPAEARPARILIAEDEASLADLVAESLRGRGHLVDIASDGAQALERSRTAHYDLLISDLKMPRMDGLELYERIRKIRPHLARRIIFTTGDVASPRTQAFLRRCGAPVLNKPFDLEEVHGTVSRVLGEDRG